MRKKELVDETPTCFTLVPFYMFAVDWLVNSLSRQILVIFRNIV